MSFYQHDTKFQNNSKLQNMVFVVELINQQINPINLVNINIVTD
jgi:hypothetical protein